MVYVSLILSIIREYEFILFLARELFYKLFELEYWPFEGRKIVKKVFFQFIKTFLLKGNAFLIGTIFLSLI